MMKKRLKLNIKMFFETINLPQKADLNRKSRKLLKMNKRNIKKT